METTLKEKEQPSEGLSSSLRWQIGLAFFAFVLIGAAEAAVGVIIPSLQTQYRVDKATIGTLFFLSATGYMLAAFGSGWLVEKIGPQRFLIGGTSIFLGAVALISLRPPFEIIIVSWLLIGLGIASLDAGLNSYIAGLPRNTGLLNYLHAFYGVGALSGPALASTMLAVGLGWNSVYFVWIAMAGLLLAGFGLLYRGRLAGLAGETQAKSTDAEGKPQQNIIISTLKLPVVGLAAAYLFIYVGAEVSLGSWSYSFLTQERREPELLSGWLVTGYWLGLTLGRLTLGGVAARIGNSRLVQGCLAGVIAGLALIWLLPLTPAAGFGLLLVGFCFGPLFPTTIAIMSQIVPSRLLNSTIGFLASMASVGAAIFPWLAGNLMQGIGLWTLLPYSILLSLVMVLFWLLLQRQSKGA